MPGDRATTCGASTCHAHSTRLHDTIHSSTEYFSAPIAPDDTFALAYVHSVSNAPVTGTDYERREDGTIVVRHDEAPRADYRVWVSPLMEDRLIVAARPSCIASRHEVRFGRMQPRETASKQIEHIPLVMVRGHLTDLPPHAPPAGFAERFYRRGEQSSWAGVETRAGEFSTIDGALEHFAREFAPFEEAMEERCVFAIDESTGAPVGTATAWYNDARGSEWGRLHWVGVVPEHQGKGIGRSLVSAALRRMTSYHTKAYLTTQTTSVAAVRIYLDVGFRPSI